METVDSQGAGPRCAAGHGCGGQNSCERTRGFRHISNPDSGRIPAERSYGNSNGIICFQTIHGAARMITFDVFTPGKGLSDSAAALDRQLVNEDPDMTYSQMMRFRLSGQAASECTDTYFIATQAGRYVARLWHGWGKHPLEILGTSRHWKVFSDKESDGNFWRCGTMISQGVRIFRLHCSALHPSHIWCGSMASTVSARLCAARKVGLSTVRWGTAPTLSRSSAPVIILRQNL